jgi:hypothetical protein
LALASCTCRSPAAACRERRGGGGGEKEWGVGSMGTDTYRGAQRVTHTHTHTHTHARARAHYSHLARDHV